MSILPICTTGEPVLHRAAASIDPFNSELRDPVAGMVETTHTTPGVGFTVPQVGVDSQVLVWRYDDADSFDAQYRDVLQFGEGPAHGFNTALHGVVVNPTLDLVWDTEGTGVILPEEPDIALESEGCPSVPGYGYPLRRVLGMILRGYDVDGNVTEVRARRWLVYISQYEYDHLQGTLYADRLTQPYVAQAQQAIAEREWGASGRTWAPGERA